MALPYVQSTGESATGGGQFPNDGSVEGCGALEGAGTAVGVGAAALALADSAVCGLPPHAMSANDMPTAPSRAPHLYAQLGVRTKFSEAANCFIHSMVAQHCCCPQLSVSSAGALLQGMNLVMI